MSSRPNWLKKEKKSLRVRRWRSQRKKEWGNREERRPFTFSSVGGNRKDKKTFVFPDPTTPPILQQEERGMADRFSTEDSGREFLKILSEKGTVGILRYLSTHDKGHYSSFDVRVSVSTLNIRLRQLLQLGLINHSLEREPVRQEWYVITKKGRKTLKCLEELIEISHLSSKLTEGNL